MTAIILTPEQHAQIVEALENSFYDDSVRAYGLQSNALTLLRSLEPVEPVAWRKRDTGQLESAAAFAEPYNWGDKSKWNPLYAKEQADPVSKKLKCEDQPDSWINNH